MTEDLKDNRHLSARAAWPQRLGFLLAAIIIVFVVFLRMRQCTQGDRVAISTTYNRVCTLLVDDGDFSTLYDETRSELRDSSMDMEVHFLFEFVRRMNGEKPIVEDLEPYETPIRAAIRELDFDRARRLVRDAQLAEDGMKPGRAGLWMRLIDKLEIRVENDCRIDF